MNGHSSETSLKNDHSSETSPKSDHSSETCPRNALSERVSDKILLKLNSRDETKSGPRRPDFALLGV